MVTLSPLLAVAKRPPATSVAHLTEGQLCGFLMFALLLT